MPLQAERSGSESVAFYNLMSTVLSFLGSVKYRSDQHGLGLGAWSSGKLGWLKR